MMNALYKIGKPALMAMDAEKAHNLTLKSLKTGLFTKESPQLDSRLHVTLANMRLSNPLGLAAGFDKNADCPDAMFGFGFGFVELGTVTPLPQAGNPKPRVFRDPATGSVINRMGFPNAGADVFEKNLQSFRASGKNRSGLVGINIGKNKDTQDAAIDYLTLIERLGEQADYLTINISSPNTPGLRDLQSRENLQPLLENLIAHRDKHCPGTSLFLKLAPDLTEAQSDDIAQTCLACGIDGLILSNTTLARPKILPDAFAQQQGGLSGSLLTDPSTDIIARFYTLTSGRIPIIGIGGVHDAHTAYEKIKAGATAIQLYTGMVYHGPALVTDILNALPSYLEKDGFNSIAEATGSAHDKRIAAA